jgi:hypothetical protein
MSSFSDVDEDESEEKDIVGTTLACEGYYTTCCRYDWSKYSGSEQITATVTPSVIMAAEEKGSSKPALAEDKRKGLAKFEEVKKATEDDTPLSEGPFD